MTDKRPVLCVGMMSCDSYYCGVDADVLLKRNAACERVEMAAGGDATNVAIDLARMGCPSRLIGLVGQDFHGDGLIKTAREAGVDTSRVVRRADVTSTMTMIIYLKGASSPDDRHCTRNAGGNARLSEADITDDRLLGARHLHYGSFGPMESLDGAGLARLLARARALGMTTSLDVKGTGRDFEKLKAALPYVDMFLPNLEELGDLTGLDRPDGMAALIHRLGAPVVAIKMAERGVYVSGPGEAFTLPTLARPEEIADIMGAGDAFCAGFIAASLENRPLRERAAAGSLCAKACLATRGASAWTLSLPSLLAGARQMANA